MTVYSLFQRRNISKDEFKNDIEKFMKEYVLEEREEARILLEKTQEAYSKLFWFFDSEGSFPLAETSRRFSILRSSLQDRLDVEPRAPRYESWRQRIRAAGGCLLGDIATVFKPASRYKTNYVDDTRFGVPMMNGRQISQYRPIALRSMSLNGFSDPDAFRLKIGMTLLTADGRAEENLADCALVTPDRDGWGASGHVHRVSPHDGIHPGLVYLACSCAPVQTQLKALATGSVVDALSDVDVASVTALYDSSYLALSLGDDAVKAWQLFARASSPEDDAIAKLEAAFQISELRYARTPAIASAG